MQRCILLVMTLTLVTAALTGCATRTLHLSVSPGSAFLDRALSIRVSGADPGAATDVRLTTASSDGTRWSSRAVFRADARGMLTADQAPASGDYRGARPMGLVEALHPPPSRQDAQFDPPAHWTMTITATTSDSPPVHATVTRLECPAVVRARTLTVAKDGVDGQLDEPLHPEAAARPAVVVIPGSDGALPTADACLLAAHGYPAMAVRYFNAPGLPKQLASIPLEYFQRAARLLATEPHVDPHRIVLWGNSRGSEAALLTAAHFPGLVRAVIGTVPSSDVHPATSSPAAAWTLRGHPLPFTTVRRAPTVEGPAAIPVEGISGPILLVCAGQDEIWGSCPYARGIRSRLQQHHAATPLTLLAYPLAGHFVGTLTPDIPLPTTAVTVPGGGQEIGGGTMLANDRARDDAYPRLLDWMTALQQ